MSLNNYTNILASGIWSNKYPHGSHILALVVVAQKLSNDSKKPSENTIRDSTKGYKPCIRYLQPWLLEEPKLGVGHKLSDEKGYWLCK